jgi:hypothetical protein
MFRTDRQKMIAFISRQLPDGEAMLVLASGPGGGVSAFVSVEGDGLDIISNCPEWVSVREVYEHLRWEAMPAWEQWECLRACRSTPTPDTRLERLADRFESVLSGLVGAAPTSPTGRITAGCGVETTTSNEAAGNTDNKLQVIEAEGVVVLGSCRFVLEPEYIAIISCLLSANGGWVSQGEMKANKKVLQPFIRLDRTIRKLKRDYRTIAKGIEAERGRGFRLKVE